MARTVSCDICKKTADRVVAKLHYIPMHNKKRTTHSDYTHQLDVGECCGEKILNLGFRKRMTREQYNNQRKGVKSDG